MKLKGNVSSISFFVRLALYFCTMKWIDTHTHTYDTSMGQNPDEMVAKAISAGVGIQIQGGVDLTTVEPIKDLAMAYPGHVYATIGLHPTSVKEDYLQVLDSIHRELSLALPSRSPEQSGSFPFSYIGIGEIGLDLYWDKTFLREQLEALRIQFQWAKDFHLPVVLHVRDAFEEVWHVLKELQDGSLQGVFHCFSGNVQQAARVIDLGFKMGIGGVLTFKNSKLYEVVQAYAPSHFVLETDSPYLAPVPFRGTPNNSSNIPLIGQRLAELWDMSIEEVSVITSANARGLFRLM